MALDLRKCVVSQPAPLDPPPAHLHTAHLHTAHLHTAYWRARLSPHEHIALAQVSFFDRNNSNLIKV